MVHDGQSADDAAVAQARGDLSPPSDAATPGAGASPRPKARTWRDKAAAATVRAKTGFTATFWSGSGGVDFMNSAIMFAGLMLVCFFPFLAVVSAAAGRDLGPAITVRMGLNAQAAHDVDALSSDGHQTVWLCPCSELSSWSCSRSGSRASCRRGMRRSTTSHLRTAA